MDPVVQRAFAEGILSPVSGTNSFKCALCETTFCGGAPARQHLGGRGHAKNGAAHILANPADRRESLRKLVSARLLAAAERKEVRGLRCTVCDLGFDGAAPLEQHVAGSDHAKKLLASGIPRGAEAGPTGGGQLLRPTISHPAAQCDDSGPIECSLCNTTCTGKQSYDAHVRGKKHQKKAFSLSLQRVASVDNAPKRATSLITHDGNGPVVCVLCGVHCTGKQSFDEHVKGEKHRKKAMAKDLEMRAQRATPAFVVPAVSPVQATPAFVVLAASTHTSLAEPSTGTRKTYRVNSIPRGFVYVFNNKFTGQEGERLGAELDSVNLKETFTALGYAVFLKENLRAQQMKDELDIIRVDRRLNDVDALIIFFLSHGSSPYSFSGNDNKDLDLRSLRRKFANSKCPQMRGKPKVFFANYCRGDRFQKRIEFDSALEYDDGSVEAPRDMVTIQAAIEGVKVPRNEAMGTYFVKCLCDILRHHGRSKSLKDVYHELDERTREVGGTQPMWEDYIFHDFFF